VRWLVRRSEKCSQSSIAWLKPPEERLQAIADFDISAAREKKRGKKEKKRERERERERKMRSKTYAAIEEEKPTKIK